MLKTSIVFIILFFSLIFWFILHPYFPSSGYSFYFKILSPINFPIHWFWLVPSTIIQNFSIVFIDCHLILDYVGWWSIWISNQPYWPRKSMNKWFPFQRFFYLNHWCDYPIWLLDSNYGREQGPDWQNFQFCS